MTVAIIVTSHALHRWCERIEPNATLAQAADAIHRHSPAIRIALEFGARVVRLGNGAKLVLHDGVVATVYRREWMVGRV